MNKHYFSIAGFNIALNFHNTDWIIIKNEFTKNILKYLKGFELKSNPKNIDYSVDFIWENISNSMSSVKLKTYYLGLYKIQSEKRRISYYRISILEFQLLLKNILYFLLLKKKGFILHASAAKTPNGVNIFLAKSGGGKSTIKKLVKDHYPSFADDYVILRKHKDAYYAYQTPFIEKDRKYLKSSEKIKICKIFFLRKSNTLFIKKISQYEQVLKLISKQNIMINIFLERQMKIMMEFSAKFKKFYTLYFKKEKKGIISLIEKTI